MKKSVVIVVLFVLLSSSVIAVEDSCDGFWGTVSCFLWGNPERVVEE